MTSFNLVDEPWIPCMTSAQDPPRPLSLRAVFEEAPRLWQIVDPSPAVEVSLHRLLLAILHRSLDGPRTVREWEAVWRRGGWDVAELDAYLTRWHDRFDLFDDRRPFYQTLGPDPSNAVSVTLLAHDRASDRNRPLLFDHSPDGTEIAPAAAARSIVAQQNFATGGLVAYDRGREPNECRHATASPLMRAAVCLVRGANLFQTLMLNWYRYNRADGVPFAFHGDDAPAWERDGGARPEQRVPDGYVDLLTWQSRRLLVLPQVEPDGRTVVRRAFLMKGYQLPTSFEPWSAETMVAFRKNARATEGEAWSPLGIRTDRTVWRDSHALFRSVADERERPRMLDWIGTLMADGALRRGQVVPMDVYGLVPDQAKILDWRRETLPLPLAFIGEEEMLETLRKALELAEGVGDLLRVRDITLGPRGKPVATPMAVLCEGLLAGMSERSPDKRACGQLAEHFGATRPYWARLDTPFRTLVTEIPEDVTTDEYGNVLYGQRAILGWAEAVQRSARDAFDDVVNGLDRSKKAYRAAAIAEERFGMCLRILMAPHRTAVTAKGGSV